MRLEWLEDILAISQTGSFVAAAERRRLTQSAFSRRVQQIEDYVGVELFDRSRKPVQLRPTTEAQRDQILHLTAALRQLVADLRRGDRTASNKIVLASQHALTTSLTPRLIEGLHLAGQDIYVRLRSANYDECFALLLSRQAEIAIVYRLPDEVAEIGGDYLEMIDIGMDSLIPVFAADQAHRVGAGLELPYIAYPSDVFFGKVAERKILPHLGRFPAIVPKAETALTLAALEMAALGVAVAWVPRSLVPERIASGRLVDLSDRLPSCDLQVRAVRLKGSPGPVEVAFWSQLADLAPKP